eukprot:g8853.t1
MQSTISAFEQQLSGEADLLVLKTAVKRLRDQAEQIQYLECLLKKGRTGHSASPRRLSPMAPQERRWEDRQTGCWFAARANLRFFLTKSCKEPWSPPRTAVQSPADRLDGRSFLSPSSQTRNVGELTPSTPESGHLEGPAPLKSFASRLPVAGPTEAQPVRPTVPNRDDRAPPLMSFLDTQDLLTNSSSSSAPMFHGSKLAIPSRRLERCCSGCGRTFPRGEGRESVRRVRLSQHPSRKQGRAGRAKR